MHVFFSGIGGTAIGPLALISKQVGYEVTGSDKQDSQYIDYLRKKGISDIHIGQTAANIAKVHEKNPIDWYVYSSAVSIENPSSPELEFCEQQGIKTTKRDALLNKILSDNELKLLAVAGTHGKTTTTAMLIWLFKQLDLPISYSVGAKISFGDMGSYQKKSQYFIYECDEFDRNFLEFEPFLSVITGVSWDHHEIFPTREDYIQAFAEFVQQSDKTLMWQEDHDYLGLGSDKSFVVQDSSDPKIESIKLDGKYNRLDAWLAIQTLAELTGNTVSELISLVDKFPGLQRRMEQIANNLYSDYAHTPEKIRGAMSVASEMATKSGQQLVVLYEPLTNRRQHFMIDDYKDCFSGAQKLYWLPSYLAREDPKQRIIPPEEMISHLDNPSIAVATERNKGLIDVINNHLNDGDMVVGLAGGGGDSLDEWLRTHFSAKHQP